MTDPPEYSGGILPWEQPAIASTLGALAYAADGSPDSFTGLLFRLIQKADPQNRARLARGYPIHLAMYDTWHAALDPVEGARRARQLWERAAGVTHDGLRLDLRPIAEPTLGPLGVAEPIPVPDVPDAAETVAMWLVTAPDYHPFWLQYAILAVRLRDDVPGFPPPKRQFAGATHEILVVALNPETGPHSPESLTHPAPLPYLQPINVAEQFVATDDEIRDLASLAAQGVVHGALRPEPIGSVAELHEPWLTSLTKTLAHLRGEEHAP